VQNEKNIEHFEQLRCNLNSARLSYRKTKENDSLSPSSAVVKQQFNKRQDISSARKKRERNIKHLYLDDKENFNQQQLSATKRKDIFSPKKSSKSNMQIENMFGDSENKIMNQLRLESKQKTEEERSLKNKALAESSDLKSIIDKFKKENLLLKRNNTNLTDKIKILETSLSKVSNNSISSGQSNIFKSKEMAFNKKVFNLQYKIRHLKLKEHIYNKLVDHVIINEEQYGVSLLNDFELP